MKTIIIKRTIPYENRVSYVIQQKHSLFRWWWVDASINSICGANCQDSFGSIEEAKKNLCRFDGSPMTEEVIE